jgi:hypothetical protein
MCQKHLATAITGESEFLHDIGLLCLRDGGTVKVGALAVFVTLELLETALVVQPLVGQHLATIHTAHGDNHRITVAGDFADPSQL